jgi:hypothetical protein
VIVAVGVSVSVAVFDGVGVKVAVAVFVGVLPTMLTRPSKVSLDGTPFGGLNLNTRFGGVGSVCQVKGEKVPTAPIAVKFRFINTPAPLSGKPVVLLQDNLISPAVRAFGVQAQG